MFKEIVQKENVKKAIKKFCEGNSTRQRDVLYDVLNKEFEIELERPVYDYSDKRSDAARFECGNKDEVNWVIDRVIRELKKK